MESNWPSLIKKFHGLVLWKKYSKILLKKEWMKLENCTKILLLKNFIEYFKGSIANVDFSNFTDAENLYNELELQRIKLEDAEK